ncbi:MAG: 3-oxoacyl-[acyl-carrier-protein] synthase III C-terminal domain-containing protein [Syntrophobacteraceae bacterium]
MIGIVAFGSFVPFNRLSRSEIGKVWGKGGGAGEKAVAGFDQDSVTMATEAVLDSLRDVNPDEVDSLYFASIRPPYAQKQAASIVATVCNLREDVATMDFGQSLRAGTNALRAAVDAVKAKSVRKAVVTASECSLAPADSADELALGDGAAAFVIGDTDVVASVEQMYSVTSDFLDYWRLPEDRFVQSWEERFVLDMGYARVMKEAVLQFVKKFNVDLKSFAKVILNAPNDRSHKTMAKSLKIDDKQQLQYPFYTEIGNTGTASAMIMLVAALEAAKPGDKILVANYADGVDIFTLQVTDAITRARKARTLKTWLDTKLMMANYGKYLYLRDMMEWEVDRRPAPRTSLPILYREGKGLMRLVGKRCKACGHEQFPRTRVCMWCQARLDAPESYDDVPMASKTGVLFSFNKDARADVADLPNVNCVVDLEGGARFYGLMTDRDLDKLQIGMQMEFTFRKINDAQGMRNYFWKVRPIR